MLRERIGNQFNTIENLEIQLLSLLCVVTVVYELYTVESLIFQ